VLCYKHIFLLTFIIVFTTIRGFAQAVDEPGNAPSPPPGFPPIEAGADSVLSDTSSVDTARATSELDTVVNYAAERVVTTFNPRVTVLTGNANVSYKTMSLTAHRIEVHWDDDMLYAEGRLDTVALDSSEGGGDTLVWKDMPRLKDGAEVVDGRELYYHLKTRKGRIIEGNTQYDEGFCHGATIKKVDRNVMNIRSGYYTTCDRENPHYYFWSRDIKLIVKDRIIARPVVLYFGPVPVMIIPYGVFPAKGGRHSGLIIPTYGESASQGRFLRHLGYYWAPNDYFDVKTMLDFYEKFGIQLTSDAYYVKRYRYNGNISGSLVNKRYSDRVENRWRVRLSHKHTLSPSASLNLSGEYQSDASFMRDLDEDPVDRLKQFVKSDATLSKRWPGTPYSGSINVNHYEVLQTGEITQWLPQLRFSRSKLPFFPQSEDADPEDARWYNRLYFSYRGETKRKRWIKTDRITRTEITPADTLLVTDYSKRPWRYKSGTRHDLSLSASQKPFSYFSLTQSINYSEAWFDEWLEWRQNPDLTVDSVKHDEFRARRTFNGSISLGTTLYGLFHPGIFGIEALRHKLDPSLSLSYSPDFSEPRWNYYDVFRDSTGREMYFDRFKDNLYGGTPRHERMSLGISIGNLFQYKRVKDDKEVRGDLFDLLLSTSHNFAADSLKWSDLRSLLKFSPRIGSEGAGGSAVTISGLSINLRGAHSFYDQVVDPVSGRRIQISDPAPEILRLVNFDLSVSFSVRSRRAKAARDTSVTGLNLPVKGSEEERMTGEVWRPTPIPWDAGISFHYSENHNNPDNITRNTTAGFKLSTDITPNWSVGYTTKLDLDRKRVTLAGFNIHRDMHCWEGSLSWTPVGSGKGYYLRIGIKSAQLRDVKVEKRKGRAGIGGY